MHQDATIESKGRALQVHSHLLVSALADASNVCTLSSHRVHRDSLLHEPGELSCFLVHSRLKRRVHSHLLVSALADASNVCTLSSHRVHRDSLLHEPGELSCFLVHSRLKRGHQAQESALDCKGRALGEHTLE